MDCRVRTDAENKREMSSAVGRPVVKPAPPNDHAGTRSKTADERLLPRALQAT